MFLREVIPEILDSLPPDDPGAARSRRDLRRLNFFMGNDRWIYSTLKCHPEKASEGIVEIGAGEGELLKKLTSVGFVSGVDLLPRPSGLDASIGWDSGNILEQSKLPKGQVLIANLFLHHFVETELARIGELCESFKLLIFSEPHRSRKALRLSQCITPLVGSVTRHDMPVSIRAGFTMGELPSLLGLSDQWAISEYTTALGAIRTVARRQS